MRKHTEHPGDGGSLELHHGRLAGDDSVVPSARGFLSLMRTVVAVLGFLIMAWTSGTMSGRPGVPEYGKGVRHAAQRRGDALAGQDPRGGRGIRTDVESV